VETTAPEHRITLPVDLNTADAKFRVRTVSDRGESADVESDPFTIDSAAPDIGFVVNGSSDWVAAAATEVELEDNLSGIRTDRLRYLWSQDPDQPGADAAWETFASGELLTLEGLAGSWYVHIQAEDGAG